MKSVSVEEVEQMQLHTYLQFSGLFPALQEIPNVDNVEKVKAYFKAKQEMELHLVRVISHYRLFVDRLNKANDFEAFSEELFTRQLDAYKEKLAEMQNKVTESNKHEEVVPSVDFDNTGDFNEVK